MPIRRGAVLLSAAVFTAPTAAAQTAADTVRLDDVVVTATRTDASRASLAASVTVVTGDELRRRGIRFIADWLEETPGVALARNGSFGALTTLFLRGGESDYTKLLVDGVPLNAPGGAVNLAHLSTDNVERIEILRGPASVLYGSDAVAGVIQVITRRGRGSPRFSARARAGSFGTSDVQGGYTGGSEHAEWSVSAARYETAGIYPFNNRYRSVEGSGRLGIRPDDLTDLALTVRWGDHRARFPTDFAGVAVDSNQFTTDQSLALTVEGGRRLSDRITVRVLAGLVQGDAVFDDRPDGPGDTLGFAFASTRSSRLTRRVLDVRALTRVSDRLHLTTGAEVAGEAERVASRSTSNFGEGPVVDSDTFDHDRGHAAGYAQVLWHPGTAVDVQLGARADRSDVFGSFLTGRAGVVVRPAAGLRVHGAVGTAFKAPTFPEQFAATPFEIGDPDLRPERTRSWEAGVEAALSGGAVTLGVTWFDQHFRDLIQYAFSGPDEPTYLNVARASARGVEASAAWSPVTVVSLRGSWTGLRTRATDAGDAPSVVFQPGARLLRRPASTLALGARLLPRPGTSLGIDLIRSGERDDVDFTAFPAQRVRLPAWSAVHVSADVPVRGAFGLTLAVRNLFDAGYESVVGYPGIGRLILVGARY